MTSSGTRQGTERPAAGTTHSPCLIGLVLGSPVRRTPPGGPQSFLGPRSHHLPGVGLSELCPGGEKLEAKRTMGLRSACAGSDVGTNRHRATPRQPLMVILP